MILSNYLKADTPVVVTFVGPKPSSAEGTILDYDEHHIVLMSNGRTNYVPWSAVGMVTDYSKK